MNKNSRQEISEETTLFRGACQLIDSQAIDLSTSHLGHQLP